MPYTVLIVTGSGDIALSEFVVERRLRKTKA